MSLKSRIEKLTPTRGGRPERARSAPSASAAAAPSTAPIPSTPPMLAFAFTLMDPIDGHTPLIGVVWATDADDAAARIARDPNVPRRAAHELALSVLLQPLRADAFTGDAHTLGCVARQGRHRVRLMPTVVDDWFAPTPETGRITEPAH